MEPLRGGRLCQLSEEDAAVLHALRPKESPAGWAFRFLQSIPSVGVTLSGMSTMEQLQENLSFFETEQPLSPEEWDTLQQIARAMTGGVPCTSCHYCTSHCSQELDIPMLLKLYNEHTFTGGGFLAPLWRCPPCLLTSSPPPASPAAPAKPCAPSRSKFPTCWRIFLKSSTAENILSCAAAHFSFRECAALFIGRGKFFHASLPKH